jgi:hypothetical protein
MTGSARFDICLTVVIVANISAAQNAPISTENIKRGSTTHSALFENPITPPTLSGVNPLSFGGSDCLNRGGKVKWPSIPMAPAVPELSTWAMLLIGFAGLIISKRRLSKPRLSVSGRIVLHAVITLEWRYS